MKKLSFKIQYLILYLVLFLPSRSLFSQVGDPPTVTVTLDNPIKAKTFQELVEAILEVVVAIGTPIAILAIIYSGFLFVSARGNSEKLVKAREAFMWTIIGVAVLLGAKVLSTVISGTIKNLG